MNKTYVIIPYNDITDEMINNSIQTSKNTLRKNKQTRGGLQPPAAIEVPKNFCFLVFCQNFFLTKDLHVTKTLTKSCNTNTCSVV